MNSNEISFKYNLILRAKLTWSKNTRRRIDEVRKSIRQQKIPNSEGLIPEPFDIERIRSFEKAFKLDCLELKVKKDINSKQEHYIEVSNEDELELFNKLGEKEYIRTKNQERWENILKDITKLKEHKKSCDPNTSRFKVIHNKIKRLEEWDGIYYEWSEEKGYDIPQLIEKTKTKKISTKYKPQEMASKYIELFKTFGREPSQNDLADNSQFSQPTWSRALNDPSVIEKILKFAEIEAKNKSGEQEKYIHLVSTFESLKAKKSFRKSKSKEVLTNYPQRDESIIDPDNNIDREQINGMTKDEIISEINLLRPDLKKEELSKHSTEDLKIIFLNLT